VAHIIQGLIGAKTVDMCISSGIISGIAAMGDALRRGGGGEREEPKMIGMDRKGNPWILTIVCMEWRDVRP
jgi:hypothetical protein